MRLESSPRITEIIAVQNRKPAAIVLATTAVVWVPALLTALWRELGLGGPPTYLSSQTLAINLAGLFFLVLGACAGAVPRLKFQPRAIRRFKVLLPALIALCTLGAVLSYFAWLSLGINPLQFQDDTLYQMNVAYSEAGRVTTGVTGRLQALTSVVLLLVIYLWRAKRLTTLTTTLTAIGLVVLLISPRRSLIIQSLIFVTVLWVISSRTSLSRLTAIVASSGLILVTLFGYTQFVLGKIPEFTISGVADSVLHYYISSLYVMDQLLNTGHFEKTWIVLSTPIRAFAGIMGEAPDVDLSIPFVFLPEPSNTVPAFYYFYKSGGWIAVFAWSAMVGLATTLSLRAYQQSRSFFSAVAATLLLTGILLSIRECLFITYDFAFWLVAAYVVSHLVSSRVKIA